MSEVSAYEKFKVRVFGSPYEQGTRCWLLHKWNKWSDSIRINCGFGFVLVQLRVCNRCNYQQMKRERMNF